MKQKNIEVVVDEPIAGCYYWALRKAGGGCGRPVTVDCAVQPTPSHAEAMMAGIEALERRADACAFRKRYEEAPDTVH